MGSLSIMVVDANGSKCLRLLLQWQQCSEWCFRKWKCKLDQIDDSFIKANGRFFWRIIETDRVLKIKVKAYTFTRIILSYSEVHATHRQIMYQTKLQKRSFNSIWMSNDYFDYRNYLHDPWQWTLSCSATPTTNPYSRECQVSQPTQAVVCARGPFLL